LVPSAAEVADGNTNVVLVEVPSLGTGLADSLRPPSTSNVVGRSSVDSGALAIDDGVSLIASLTDSFLNVELEAVALDLTADSVSIEVVSLRTFDTRVTTPDPASEVVIKLDKESGIGQLLFGQLY
jgi:hypothetical protein